MEPFGSLQSYSSDDDGEGANLVLGEAERRVVRIVGLAEDVLLITLYLKESFDHGTLSGINDIDLSPLQESNLIYLPASKDVAAGILWVHRGSTDTYEEVGMDGRKVRHVISCAVEFGDTTFIPSVEASDSINGNERKSSFRDFFEHRSFFRI